MNMRDFPPTIFPNGVNFRQIRGFMLEIKKESDTFYGTCEVCHGNPSSRIFNIGSVLHHLCEECFEKMLRSFSAQCRLEKTGSAQSKARNDRNCDVGTSEEQQKRFRMFCSKMYPCHKCSITKRRAPNDVETPCVMIWAQMPYEGEAK